MNKEKLEIIKNDLLKRKAQLETELETFAKKDEHIKDNYRSEFPDYGDKDDDNAKEIEQYTDNLSIEYSLESSLRDINKALEKIAKGTYGICVHCGQEIAEERLMARPASSSCVECKEKLTNQ